jgi:long-chain acyl-CoA synthetase
MEWTLANIIRAYAAARGGKPMLTYAGRTISYVEMDAVSSRVAQGLLAEGIGRQDRVAFLDENGPGYFEVLFSGAKINAVNVAVN